MSKCEPLRMSHLVEAVDRYFGKNQRFFKSRKGENFEMKADLNSDYKIVRKDAVKKVIANMTLGKDVSDLFADVLKCMQTDDLELKKLVYLYLMNYAKTQPELVILAINTFVKDTDDINPLIRALAIRTMGCLRCDKIIDYLFEPLRKGLMDQDPYVLKTAAMCVVKMYHLSPEQTRDYGFIRQLQDLLHHDNPMVFSNALQALFDINELPDVSHKIDMLQNLTEWGQITMLQALCQHHLSDDQLDALLPRLQHSNPALVLMVIKILLLHHKIEPCLSSIQSILKTSTPECQYAFIKSIPYLDLPAKCFYINYTDPLYLKTLKLHRILHTTITQADLLELKEYCLDVDVEFAASAMTCLKEVAISKQCDFDHVDQIINLFLDILKQSPLHPEISKNVIAIIRHFPSHHTVLQYMPITKYTIQFMGEYPQHISGIYQVLEQLDCTAPHLTTALKCWLKRPQDTHLQQILQDLILKTQEQTDIDLVYKGHFYKQVLQQNPKWLQTKLKVMPPKALEQSFDLSRMCLLSGLVKATFEKHVVPVKEIAMDDLIDLGEAEAPTVGMDNEHFSVQYHWSQMTLHLVLKNKTNALLHGFEVQMNKNHFGLCPSEAMDVQLGPMEERKVSLLLMTHESMVQMSDMTVIELAIKCNAGIFVETLDLNLECVLKQVMVGEMLSMQNRVTIALDELDMSKMNKWLQGNKQVN